MTKIDAPRLCGGTFFTQILLSRRDTPSKRQRTQGKTDIFHNEDVLYALLQIVQPDAIKPTGSSFETYTTNFKKCDGSIGEDLKFRNDAVIFEFERRLRENHTAVLYDMAVFCELYIDLRDTIKNHVLLVKRLIELIRDDNDISSSQRFTVGRNGETKAKSELPAINGVYLPAFLLSVWAFIVTERKDNSMGRSTILAWHSVPNVKGRYNGIDGSSISQGINVTFDYSPMEKEEVENESGEDADETASEPYVFEKDSSASSSPTNQIVINGNLFNAKNQYFGNVENVFND